MLTNALGNQVCLNPAAIVRGHRVLSRLLLSAVLHVDDVHLYYNMVRWVLCVGEWAMLSCQRLLHAGLGVLGGAWVPWFLCVCV